MFNRPTVMLILLSFVLAGRSAAAQQCKSCSRLPQKYPSGPYFGLYPTCWRRFTAQPCCPSGPPSAPPPKPAKSAKPEPVNHPPRQAPASNERGNAGNDSINREAELPSEESPPANEPRPRGQPPTRLPPPTREESSEEVPELPSGDGEPPQTRRDFHSREMARAGYIETGVTDSPFSDEPESLPSWGPLMRDGSSKNPRAHELDDNERVEVAPTAAAPPKLTSQRASAPVVQPAQFLAPVSRSESKPLPLRVVVGPRLERLPPLSD